MELIIKRVNHMGKRINPILFRLAQSRKWKNSTFQYNYPTFLKESLKIEQFLTNLNFPLEIKKWALSSSKKTLTYSALTPLPDTSRLEQRLGVLSGIPNLKLRQPLSLKLKELPIFHPKLLLELLATYPDIPSLLKNFPSPSVLGIKLQLKGRIKGIAKAKRITYIKGTLPLQKIQAKIDYCSLPIKTAHGIIGTQLWIYYRPFR